MSSRPWAVGAAVAASVAAGYGVLIRPWQLSWHATSQEARARLDGDDLLPRPDLTATRAISIRASVDRVWPWLAQLGQEHGGFYSYDALETLVGSHIRSARRIIPRWQGISPGDQVQLTLKVRLSVAMVAPGRAIVLQGGGPAAGLPPPYDFTWAFVLTAQPGGTTRLVVRERYRYTRRWAPLLAEPFAAVSFLMTQQMLRGLRDRAERGTPPGGPGLAPTRVGAPGLQGTAALRALSRRARG